MAYSSRNKFGLHKHWPLVITSLALVAGCSTAAVLESHFLAHNVAYTNQTETGLVYALPRALITVKASWDGETGTQPTLSIEPPQFLPDPAHRFVLSSRLDAFSIDKVDVTVENGLLTALNSDTSDQTKAALTTFVDVLTETRKIARIRKTIDGAGEQAFSVSATFDPLDAKSIAQATQLLHRHGFELNVSGLDGATLAPSRQATNAGSAACTASICYRVPIGATVTVHGHGNWHVHEGKTVLVPDTGFVGGYDVTRAACVQKVSKLTLNKGMLTKLDVDKPSEVVGCLSIPLEVLKKLLEVPKSLFTSEQAQIKAEADLLKAQTDLLKAQVDLANAQADAATE
jgi:hypothetical protein